MLAASSPKNDIQNESDSCAGSKSNHGSGSNTSAVNSMRGRWLKTLSVPFQLSVPDEVQVASESKLANLIIPLASTPRPTRSPQHANRSLTPPPTHSPAVSPFSLTRSFDKVDGILSSGNWFGLSAHQGPRPLMQDSGTCQPNARIFVLADGHGKSGHIVAALTTSLLPTFFTTARQTSSSVEDAVMQAFQQMEQHLITHTSHGGATCTFAHITEEIAPSLPTLSSTSPLPSPSSSCSSSRLHRVLYLSHLGDTRAVLAHRERGSIPLTDDHKPDHPAERAAIEARGGRVTHRSKGRSSYAEHERPRIGTSAPNTPPRGRTSGDDETNTKVSNPFSHAFTPLPNSDSLPSSLPSLVSSSSSTLAAPSTEWRVEGILNLSRSFGDQHLKQYISSVPTVHRHVIDDLTDEFLIIATDGVWNVIPNDEAVELVRQYFTRQSRSRSFSHLLSSAPIHSMAARAADLLTTTAIQRGSTDNCSCIIIQIDQHLMR